MQVKVGIHESMIEKVRPGLRAIVTLPDRTLEAEVTSVASVTRPAGWWTGQRRQVRHDYRFADRSMTETRHERGGGGDTCRA